MKEKKFFITILISFGSWVIAGLPFVVPALNVSTQILNVPVTVWIALIAIAFILIVNGIAVRYIWEIYDDSEEYDSEENKK